MESDNRSEDSDFEHVTMEQQEQEQQLQAHHQLHQGLLAYNGEHHQKQFENSSSRDNSSSSSAEDMNMLHERMDKFRVEIETLKITENTLIQEKNNELELRVKTLQPLEGLNIELQAKNRELLAIQQVAKAVETKVQENRRKFDGFAARMVDKNNMMMMDVDHIKAATELEQKVAKQLDLGSHQIQQWSNNQWDSNNSICGLLLEHVRMSTDGLLVVTETPAADKSRALNVRAKQPVTQEMLASMLSASVPPLVYYEMHLHNSERSFFWLRIGWFGADFPKFRFITADYDDSKGANNTNNKKRDYWVGDHPGSYGLSWRGKYCEPERKQDGYADLFNCSDVVGSGVLLTPEGQLKMFFTKNGRLNGKTITLMNAASQGDHPLLLYPGISFARTFQSCSAIEANFGADPAGKPFIFDIGANKAELFE